MGAVPSRCRRTTISVERVLLEGSFAMAGALRAYNQKCCMARCERREYSQDTKMTDTSQCGTPQRHSDPIGGRENSSGGLSTAYVSVP